MKTRKMSLKRTSARLLGIALLTAGLSATGFAQELLDKGSMARALQFPVRHSTVCADPGKAGIARCHAHIVMSDVNTFAAAATPSGLGPTDLRSAYAVTGSGSSNTVIAIVDAFGYPNAESDLATYRSQFGLRACTTANGCFRKVNQRGVQGNYPTTNVGWDQETALDLDMVSAMCPGCSILLVEAAAPRSRTLPPRSGKRPPWVRTPSATVTEEASQVAPASNPLTTSQALLSLSARATAVSGCNSRLLSACNRGGRYESRRSSNSRGSTRPPGAARAVDAAASIPSRRGRQTQVALAER